MYNGDKMRKTVLVDYGFRLPSALDNRPLNYEEFEKKINQAIYVSATPGDYELEHTDNKFVEQIIRPTGLLDPTIEIKPTSGQIDDIINEINKLTKETDKMKVIIDKMNLDPYSITSDEYITALDILNKIKKSKFNYLLVILFLIFYMFLSEEKKQDELER